jgi:UDP-2-acetamido-3-amino-2,3-dideoxy-glucuronate N-acetyltransferase
MALRAPGLQLSQDAEIGEGVTFGANVVIHAGVRLSDGVTVEDGAVLGKLPKLGPRSEAPTPEATVLTIGAGAVICSLAVVVAGATIGPGAVVGDHAFVRESANVGTGTVIGHGSAIGRGVRIGERARLQNNVVIAPGTTIEDEVDIGPGACSVTTGWRPGEEAAETILRHGCRVGACVVLMPGVEVGTGATVGAGSVVRDSLPAWGVAVGRPARVLHRDELGS